MKASGSFGTRWLTDRIKNIVIEGCIADYWSKCTLVPVCNMPHFGAVHTNLFSYWSSKSRCMNECYNIGSDVTCQLMTCSLASYLAWEP